MATPAATDAAAVPGRWRPAVPRRRERRQRDGRHVDARARAASTAGALAPAPGQFTMLYAFGVGEVPISVSGDAERRRSCTRSAPSAPSRARSARPSRATVLGVRGPFGNTWPVDAAAGSDVVVVAGGIGLAPLRPALYDAARAPRRVRRGRAALRQPDARRPALRRRARALARPLRPRGRRHGRPRRGRLARQGRRRAEADRAARGSIPTRRVAFVCGPEIMMRFTARALLERGVAAERIYVSLERNMQLRRRPLRPLPARPDADLPRRPGVPLRRASSALLAVREL